MPFKAPYEDVYAQALKPTLEKLGFNVVRADEFPRSTVVLDDIEKSIKGADLIVVDATDANQNVYLEFGIAMSLRKEMILLTQKASKLPFDTRHIRHLVYSPAQFDALKNSFESWVMSTQAYLSRLEKKVAAKLIRGETFDDIFDSTAHIVTTSQSIEQQIIAEIRSEAMVSCFQSYNTDKGTLHWLHLCSDPLYKVFHESIGFLASHGAELLSTVDDAFLKSNPDVISLGPGNGHKDRVLLDALLGSDNVAPEVFYYPVDVSRRMLGHAIRTVLSDSRINGKIKVKAIHAEFTELVDFRPVFDYRPGPNLFLFLGNTLGNIQNELSFLHIVKNAMHSGDVLLLEVRRQTDALELGGQDQEQVGLSFSPLARLGVHFDPEKVYRIEEDSFSQVSRTRTVATHYRDAIVDGKKCEDIFLSCVNYYDPASLERALCGKQLNFQLLRSHQTPLLAYYVLKKQ